MIEFFEGTIQPCDKVCGNCIHWISFEDMYDDDQEPSDIGFCRGNADRYYSDINETCEFFKNQNAC